jgi:hypothetical protein
MKRNAKAVKTASDNISEETRFWDKYHRPDMPGLKIRATNTRLHCHFCEKASKTHTKNVRASLGLQCVELPCGWLAMVGKSSIGDVYCSVECAKRGIRRAT